MKGTLAVLVTLFGLLAAAGGVAWWAWSELADVQMSQHGYYALMLGVTLTLILGIGLMWLVFFSHRRGYDDRVGRD